MIAQVIVDVSSSEVDKIFDYKCSEDTLLGGRVLVNFAGREIEGYVVGIKDSTDCPPEKLKSVISALEPYPVISEEQLELMRFMTHKYHLRIVDVLRLFIPAEMRSGKVKELTESYAQIAEQYRDGSYLPLIRKNSPAMLELLSFLQEKGSESTTFINKNYSAAALRNLVAKGIVELTHSSVVRTPYKDLARSDSKVTLTSYQQAALDAVNSADSAKTFLLHGVTGSGKTEVYLRCIEAQLAAGKTAIMLVPEISLTPQILSVFRARLGSRVALLHSGLSAGERFDEFKRLLCGDALVAVGARSAVFAPLKNIGVIIVDEEHDGSYFSENNPRYFTCEVADFRSRFNNCPLVLGSATPSVETYYRARTGEFTLLEMPDRINKRFPQIDICDMKREVFEGNASPFSRMLLDALEQNLRDNNQAMVYINRRGFAAFTQCHACGYVAKCGDCDVSLVYHKGEDVLKCHYCAARYKALDVCPECGGNLRLGNMGTERIAEELQKRFPSARILRMDNDTTRGKDGHLKILEQFRNKAADILVGTQMIVKGHDFPDVTLVGVLDADMSLYISDYRAAERTFQLVTQVSGRAGRDEKAGRVILQTYAPKHYVYTLSKNNNYKTFFDKEINLRDVTRFPPFSKIVRVLVSGAAEQEVSKTTGAIFTEIKDTFEAGDTAYLAAMKSPLKFLQNKYRYQILMRLTGKNIEKNLQSVYNIMDKNAARGVSIFVEQNPQSLM